MDFIKVGIRIRVLQREEKGEKKNCNGSHFMSNVRLADTPFLSALAHFPILVTSNRNTVKYSRNFFANVFLLVKPENCVSLRYVMTFPRATVQTQIGCTLYTHQEILARGHLGVVHSYWSFYISDSTLMLSGYISSLEACAAWVNT